MAREETSFEDLLKEVPAAPGAGTVSIVGTLARSRELGEFVVTLQDGRRVTLETAAVTGHIVLDTSVGQTIVRIDVDTSKIPASALSAITCTAPCYAQTPAERDAAVTPTNYAYVPADLRRYSSFVTGGGNITTSLANACAQAQRTGGAPVYIPAAMGALTVTVGVTLNNPVLVYGDGPALSVIGTANDITIFTFNTGAIGSVLRDVQLTGKGASACLPGILYSNCQYCNIERAKVWNFGVGVRYAPGSCSPFSSYLNAIFNSQIVSNNTINIDAQSQTNQLELVNVTFGGGPAQIGVSFVDSNGLAIYGGDCEGVTVTCIDVDQQAFVPPPSIGGVVISSCDLEGNSCSAGDVRLGRTRAVRGIIIEGLSLSSNTSEWFLNPLNADGVTIIGCHIESGYKSGSWINRAGNFTNLNVLGDGIELSNNLGSPISRTYNNFWTPAGHPQAWKPVKAFDAKYQDGSHHIQYALITTDMNVASGHWFAGTDVLNVSAGVAPSDGAFAAARAIIVNNSYGGGIAYSLYINGAPMRVDGQSATTAAAGTNGAPPAQVAGYLIVNVGGTNVKIPYYNT